MASSSHCLSADPQRSVTLGDYGDRESLSYESIPKEEINAKLKESVGFDISGFPNANGIYPSCGNLALVNQLARSALAFYNQQNKDNSYEFLEVVTSNTQYTAFMRFFITFVAESTCGGSAAARRQTFQARVLYSFKHDVTVEFCRLKPTQPSLSEMASDRANWKNPEIVKFFLDLCIEEVSDKGKNGSSLKVESWNIIEKRLFEKKEFKVNQRQLKNQWDYLKKKYNVWSKLVNSTTGHGFNPITNTVTWNEEKWEEYIKGNPDAKQFRYAGLQHSEEMRSLFDGVMATGVNGSGPTKEGMPATDVRSSYSSQVAAESSQVNIELNYESDHIPLSPIDPLLPKSKKSKKNEESGLDGKLERVLNTLEKSDGPTFEECNGVLDAMEKLEVDSPIYIAACSIFCESEGYRKQWIMMSKKPEDVRINWIQMNAKKLGLL